MKVTAPDLSRTPQDIAEFGLLTERRLSDAGGLTQFGAYIQTLHPGARTSDRHWHATEDEFLYMLTGTATLVENNGPSPLYPGDCICWPAGVANAHHVINRTADPCTFLIVGTRVTQDVVRYPDRGETLHIDGRTWHIVVDATGIVRDRGGDPLPDKDTA